MLPMKWQKPTSVVQKKTVTIPISRIIPRETKPEPGVTESGKAEFGTFEDRVQYFMRLIKDGVIPIAPILVQRRPDGSWFLIDGHARVSAYARLGYRNVQAVVSKNPTKLEQITT
jgi:hypothetical protein